MVLTLVRIATRGVVILTLVALAAGCQGAPVSIGDQLATQDATTSPESPAPVDAVSCAPDEVVTRWIEVALDAIRRDFPAPTIHARNLYHLSAAMWDAWAAYDPAVDGVLSHAATASTADADADRPAAIARAAHGVLSSRYATANGAEESLADFDLLLAACGGEVVDDDPAAALGAAIADEVLASTMDDGANEAGGYAAPHEPVNAPLRVSQPGTTLVDPDRWQPLELDEMVTQNGIPLDSTVQTYVGWHWGGVTPFAGPLALGLDPAQDSALDPGPPPLFDGPDGGAGYRAGVLEVLESSSQLDPRDGVLIDISPASLGGSSLGADDGVGHALNPVTGEPYEPQLVPRADYLRVIAEHWADGPTSETPPGHWNSLAIRVTDDLDPAGLRVAGTGDPVDRMEWDVKLFLALNGALHDAAIAAWGVKARYESVRPISMIRHLADLGQSSDPDGPAFHPEGIPLQPGLVEVVTPESSQPGARHEALADHVGEIAVFAWTPTVATTGDASARVRWIPASTWVPYQRPTFVTPAFAGYVSGHSTFSRAAADTLTAFTGSPHFPGGLGTFTVPAGALAFEDGPTAELTLMWATYADAADEAGRSRISGGIHVVADDHAGRVLGAHVADAAWVRAQEVFAG